jgi:hypothetical protein
LRLGRLNNGAKIFWQPLRSNRAIATPWSFRRMISKKVQDALKMKGLNPGTAGLSGSLFILGFQ